MTVESVITLYLLVLPGHPAILAISSRCLSEVLSTFLFLSKPEE